MQLTYNISREDIWQFTKFVAFHWPGPRLNAITNLLALPLVFFMILWPDRSPLVVALPLSLATGIIGIVVSLWLWKKQTKALPSDKGDQLGERILNVDARGIHTKSSRAEDHYQWGGVLEVAENPAYIFVFVDTLKAHIIPKRAFSQPQDAKEFIESLLSFWKSGQTTLEQSTM